LDKINLCYLSLNKKAINLLEQNLEKIDWIGLSENPEIFIDEKMPYI
jgi:hypothetical protein